MEGPSLYLAAEQLAPFKGKKVASVSGNSKTVSLTRLRNKKVIDIFSWGKHLVFQFDTFAIRIHFLTFGSFEATIEGTPVTGDYKKKARKPRMALGFENGQIKMYSCSVKLIESNAAKTDYDFSKNLMSNQWNPKKAVRRVSERAGDEVADVLLDQNIFAGLGNIIKNEILFLAHIRPIARVRSLPRPKLKKLVSLARSFSLQFYRWRKKFALRKNLRVHRKRICSSCGDALVRAKTGKLRRWSYYCLKEQH